MSPASSLTRKIWCSLSTLYSAIVQPPASRFEVRGWLIAGPGQPGSTQCGETSLPSTGYCNLGGKSVHGRARQGRGNRGLIRSDSGQQGGELAKGDALVAALSNANQAELHA